MQLLLTTDTHIFNLTAGFPVLWAEWPVQCPEQGHHPGGPGRHVPGQTANSVSVLSSVILSLR